MDNYQRIKFIGRGSEGTVGLYRRLSDDKIVILEEVPVDQMTKDDKEVTSNEVKVLSMLHHPNVIEYYDSFFENNTIVIVMEYAPGGTLHNYLKTRNCVPLPEKETINLFAQIVLAMHHVHSKNILHRDLKTHNIFLSKNKEIIKIGDFGISKVLSTRSKAVSLVGTPSYLSPELCEGRPYNEKSDIWALGCILYELLSLKKAFDAPTLSGVVMKIMQGDISLDEQCKPSKFMCNLLQSLLQKDPSLRPSMAMLFAHPALLTTIPKLVTLGAIPSFTVSKGGDNKNRAAVEKEHLKEKPNLSE